MTPDPEEAEAWAEAERLERISTDAMTAAMAAWQRAMDLSHARTRKART
jgi:hypothetical protein